MFGTHEHIVYKVAEAGNVWGGLAAFLISTGVVGSVIATLAIPLSEVSEAVGAIAWVVSVSDGIGAATAVGTLRLAQKGAKAIESSDPTPALEAPRI